MNQPSEPARRAAEAITERLEDATWSEVVTVKRLSGIIESETGIREAMWQLETLLVCVTETRVKDACEAIEAARYFLSRKETK